MVCMEYYLGKWGIFSPRLSTATDAQKVIKQDSKGPNIFQGTQLHFRTNNYVSEPQSVSVPIEP